MVSIIFYRVNSNRIVCISCIRTISFCSTTIIYCYSFTSCVFNSIFRNGYFVLSTRIFYIFIVCNRNISNVSITSCSCFFNYAFSRSCTTCCSRAYSVNIFTISTFSFVNSYICTSFYNSFSGFQLFIVNCISIISTRSYVSDFITIYAQVTAGDSCATTIVQCDFSSTVLNAFNIFKSRAQSICILLSISA